MEKRPFNVISSHKLRSAQQNLASESTFSFIFAVKVTIATRQISKESLSVLMIIK